MMDSSFPLKYSTLSTVQHLFIYSGLIELLRMDFHDFIVLVRPIQLYPFSFLFSFKILCKML